MTDNVTDQVWDGDPESMTGPEHYREACRLLRHARRAGNIIADNGPTIQVNEALAQSAMLSNILDAAQVHATLAQTAAQVMTAEYHLGDNHNGEPRELPRDWQEVLYP